LADLNINDFAKICVAQCFPRSTPSACGHAILAKSVKGLLGKRLIALREVVEEL
jgi:hypothetical protein